MPNDDLSVMKKNRRWKEAEWNGKDEWCTDDIWAETQTNRKEKGPEVNHALKKKGMGH